MKKRSCCEYEDALSIDCLIDCLRIRMIMIQTHNNMMSIRSSLLILLLAVLPVRSSILSRIDFTQNTIATTYPYYNTVGISMYLNEIIPYLNHSVFISRTKLSMFDSSFHNIFYQSIHVPRGYKYNCSSAIYGGNVTCTLDLALNSTIISQMNNYLYNYANSYGADLGLDLEKSNFTTTSNYYKNFKTYFNLFSWDYINLELLDYGDLAATIYNCTYTVTNFISDISSIQNNYGIYITGPGITQLASNTWVAQLQYITYNFYVVFTFRCIVFLNTSQATIPNLLSQTYSKQFLKSLFVDQNGNPINAFSYLVGINEIRLTNDSGIDGITNSFAAALWAIDISMQLAILSGCFINFYNPLEPSNQSLFGTAPNFNPTPLYYGVLFAIYALRDQPIIYYTSPSAGTSQNIKAYGLNLGTDYRVLILNKDTNPNATGEVDITLHYASGMRCMYLSAPNLSSTSNTTFAGMSFVGNSTEYVGQFSYVDYFPTAGSVYSIGLNYSQAVLCQQIPNSNSYKMKRKPNSFENFPAIVTLLFLILFLLH